jgi:type II secretory pathway pseudopilin PulG
MDSGFTIAELLIAVAVMLLVTAAVFAMLDPARGAFQAQPEVADLQQRLRVAADALASDLLMAGAGSSTGASTGSLCRFLPPILPYRTGLASPDPPGTSRTDTLTVLYVPPSVAQTTVKAAVTTEATAIDVKAEPGCPAAGEGCGFSPGMLALLFDDSGAWDLVSVASVQGSTIGRRAGGRALSKAYGPGAQLVQVMVATYAVKTERSTGVPQLRRYDGDQTDLPLVDHIVGLGLEYLGDPRPPTLDATVTDQRGPLTTYGPRPPPLGAAGEGTGYPAGENCVFKVEAGLQVPRLPVLGGGSSGLVVLPPSMFADGPWCPGLTAANRYDADLLRIRQVRVFLRAEAGPDSLRGRDPRLFLNPGTSTNVQRWVHDQEIRFDMAPRNLNLAR